MAVVARNDAQSQRGLLSIGQVLAKLSPDFPDLSPSKLRFLEEQGLVSPSRTESGYRKFSPSDVERLRLILVMQRDQYLPLRVIKDHLEAAIGGNLSGLPQSLGLSTDSALVTPQRFTRSELAKAAGASSNLVQDAVSAGFLPAAESFGQESVDVLSALVELQRSGIEPRHLTTLRTAAEREFALIERALSAVQKKNDVATRARAHSRASELSAHMDVVRAFLLRAVISKNLS